MILSELALQDPCTVMVKQTERIRIVVVGAGGTGSRLIPLLAQQVWDFNRDPAHGGRRASLVIFDYDSVEEKNVRARQNFCPPEIGFPKAQVLANRYALSFAMRSDEIEARVTPFSMSKFSSMRDTHLTILIGCVDNAAARAEIARCLEFNSSSASAVPGIWYIDAGNGEHWGQIFVGNTAKLNDLKGCLSEPIATRLPSPALLAPSMFIAADPEETQTESSRTVRLSCGDLVLSEREGNRQSRAINNHMAALVYAYVDKLLTTGRISTLATYTNLAEFDTHSVTITPAALAIALGQSPEFASFFSTSPPDEEEGEEGNYEEDEVEDEEDMDVDQAEIARP